MNVIFLVFHSFLIIVLVGKHYFLTAKISNLINLTDHANIKDRKLNLLFCMKNHKINYNHNSKKKSHDCKSPSCPDVQALTSNNSNDIQ